jgi:hypothetical protein
LPAQQGPAAAPHAWQSPAALQAFVASLQTSPAQHGWPGPPQAVHVSPIPHTVPAAVHSRFVQQGSPAFVPHDVQVGVAPPVHTVLGAVQTFMRVPQHASVAAPHVPQAPAAHVPPIPGQFDWAAMQRLFTQHPPPAHELPAQQAEPAAPHGAQVPSPCPVHTSPDGHSRPGQQTPPAAPHATHIPVTHVLPVAHAIPTPAQQAPPICPHPPSPVEVSPPLGPSDIDDAPSAGASPPLGASPTPVVVPSALLPPSPIAEPSTVVASPPPSSPPPMVALSPPQPAVKSDTPRNSAAHASRRTGMNTSNEAFVHRTPTALERHGSRDRQSRWW